MSIRVSGSPADRGECDYYYGRPPHPHKWLDPLGVQSVMLTDQAEIDAYHKAYHDADERKDWR